jgi:MFS family permease
VPLLLYGVYTTYAAFLNLFSSLILDRVGRTKLLKIGFVSLACFENQSIQTHSKFSQAGCIGMFSCFTALVATYAGTTNKVGNAFAVLTLFLWLTFYASCIDACSYVYCAEIFPTHMRTQGVAASIFGLFAMTLGESFFHFPSLVR